MSIPALLDYVLEEVSLDGEDGTTIHQLFAYVTTFYAKNPQPRTDICSLTSDSAPVDDVPSLQRPDSVGVTMWNLPNLEEEFQDYVWDLLRMEKDFIIGKNNEGRNLTLKDIVDDLRKDKIPKKSSGESEVGGSALKDQERGEIGQEKWRVYASEERRWRALTGHGVDPKKVPNAIFKCLEVIGKHREMGIIQPELTRVTGQDKKSVPVRTTMLKNQGYIEKKSVLVKNLNTSKLTLARFAFQRDVRRTIQAPPEKDPRKKGRRQLDREDEGPNFAWTGPTIDTEKLIKAILSELKLAKNRVLMHSDLKRKLGMDKSRFHWRSFSRILRKLESLGVLKRIRVPLKLNRKYTKREANREIAISEQCHARCVRYLRDMDACDWRKVLTAFSKREVNMEDEEGEGGGAVEASDDDIAKDKDADELDADAAKELENVDVDAVGEIDRDTPQWRVDKPLTNIIFDIVDKAGKDGITSMDLMSRTVGPLYYRPMDQILHRMTDFPRQSQPPQYMHLAIIRETGITGRSTHYRYFSFQWHQQLVSEGLATEPYESALKKKGVKQGSVGTSFQKADEVDIETDEFGFPVLDTSRFVKRDGTGTLRDSQLQGKKKENLKVLTSQFNIVNDNKGGRIIDWKSSNRGAGRPRRSEKGEEGPYLEETKRRAAAKSGGTPAKSRLGQGLGSIVTENMGTEPGEIQPLEASEQRVTEGVSNIQEPPAPKRRGRPPKKQKTDNGEPSVKRRYTKKTQNAVAPDITGDQGPPAETTPQNEQHSDQLVQTNSVAMSSSAVSVAKRKAPVKQTQNRKSKRMKQALPDEGRKIPNTGGEVEAASALEPGSVVDVELENTKGMPSSYREDTRLDTSSMDNSIIAAANHERGAGTSGIKTVASNDLDTIRPKPDGSTLQTPSKPVHVINGIAVEEEKLDVEGNESYGSIGGMLALARQQVVLDLIKEHGGVFPGGNELRFAFDKKYRQKNPKAGLCDRRLIRGIVQSLQYKKKIQALTFTFTSGSGSAITKKILVDASISTDSPKVDAMVREMMSVEGNLWFPPNTDLQQDIQDRFAKPPHWSLPKPREVEGVEFERIHPNSVMQLKMKRAAMAADRLAARAARIATPTKPRGRPRIYTETLIPSNSTGRRKKFTDEQKEEAARRRKAEIKAEKVLLKLNQQYRNEPLDPYDPPHTEENLPRRVWWNDFVERDLNEPRDERRFYQEIEEVEKWEKRMDKAPVAENSEKTFIMINHFAPDTQVGENFTQVPILDMDQRIRAPDFSETRPIGPRKPGPKPGSTRRKPVPKPTRTVDILMGETPKRKRRAPGSFEKIPSRRERAMTAIRKNTLRASDTLPLEELPPRRFQFRNQYIIPKEDEDSLLIAIIIVRTIFGGWDRKIDWNLVQTAIPKHNALTLQKRWPRVREIHKTHMKKLQAEFEQMFLEAYEKGELPAFNPADSSTFDLPFVVTWFRENLELPESQSVPELPITREAFDKIYELRADGPSTWRNEFHSPVLTMGNRGNHFVCHPYEIPLHEKERPAEDEETLEYIKSVIKANIITDASEYNPKKAFEILHSYPERLVDEAFYTLIISKTIAHKKDKTRFTPGRNYEFTDKFHHSLRTPMDESLFAQAVSYETYIRENFKRYKAIEVSPLTNDGSMACLFDMMASRRIILCKSGYFADRLGLIDGYKTRGMDKDIVNFKVQIKPGPRYESKSRTLPAPPFPMGNPESRAEPIRLWVDINGKLITGMWLKVTTAVLALITSRPGIHMKEIMRVLWPGLTLIEVEEIVNWLSSRGSVKYNNEGGDDTKTGCWPNEGYFLALQS